MRNPYLFQGEKYLNKPNNYSNYFEGWYFKNSNNLETISFIPGINISKTKEAFIQIITNNGSYFVDYNITDFKFGIKPFYIKIGNNIFSKDGIFIDINDNNQNLIINGNIKYSDSININSNIINPNIMGPFSYIPFMECNHAILSMKNNANGIIKINNRKINFDNSTGYIEKDWGCSFPKSYIWCQGNNFENSNASFMLSIADIPFKAFNFIGIICVLMIGNNEFKFTTYNNTKLLKYCINKNYLDITLKKDPYYLNIQSKNYQKQKLSAPIEGKMEKDIFESVSSLITVTLIKNDSVIFSDTSNNCGLEIV